MSIRHILVRLDALHETFATTSEAMMTTYRFTPEDIRHCQTVRAAFHALADELRAFQLRAQHLPPALAGISFRMPLTGKVLYTADNVPVPCQLSQVFDYDSVDAFPACVDFLSQEGIIVESVHSGERQHIDIVLRPPTLALFLTVGQKSKDRRWYREGTSLAKCRHELPTPPLAPCRPAWLDVTDDEIFRVFFQASLTPIRRRIAESHGLKVPTWAREDVGAVHAMARLHLTRRKGPRRPLEHRRAHVVLTQALAQWHEDNVTFADEVEKAVELAGGVVYFR